MELVFRKLSPAEPIAAQPGEIYLLPALEARSRRDLAKFVLEKGPGGLLAGTPPTQRLIIDANPKLDDMLAAFFVQRQLRKQSLPEIYHSFADYAAQLREGWRPTQLPLENSLEGIFLAMRARGDKPLTDPEARRQFLGDWQRLESVIVQAAEQKLDIASTPLFAMEAPGGGATFSLLSLNRGKDSGGQDGDFVRETVFLAKDMDVYQQDFARGEKWRVRLPGDSGASTGLLLRRPKSLLFKYWTKSPCPSPCGGPYRFLAVTWENGQWGFFTSSPEKLSLKPLAERLQAAEGKAAPGRADQDPWNAGKAPYTSLASPRGGSRIAEADILRIVRKWCRARSPRRSLVVLAAVAACLAVLAAVGIYWFLGGPGTASAKNRLAIHDIYVISVGVSDYPEGKLPKLKSAAHDAMALAAAFKKLKEPLCKKVVVLKPITDKDATREYILEFALGSWLHKEQSLTPRSLVVITFAGHGDIDGSDSYHFCPFDYDGDHPSTTGIFLSDVQRSTGNLPCPIVVVFDTCHSGAVKNNDDPESPQSLLKNIRSSVLKSTGGQRLVVIAACGPPQKAIEYGPWGHGALTLALLEGIDGECRYKCNDPKAVPKVDLPRSGPAGVVTLDELDRYVTERVGALTSELPTPAFRRQQVKMYHSGNIAPEQIPIAVSK